MANQFLLPDLGEGIHEAEIIAVKVKEGDNVVEDQPILEVETDKAVVEIPCPVNGVIEKIHVQAGQTVTVGSVMISFGGSATDSDEKGAGSQKQEHKLEDGSSTGSSAGSGRTVATSTAVAPARRDNGKQAGCDLTVNTTLVAATPATRRLARELGIDLKLVAGSGAGGRVMKEDVRSYAAGSLEGTISGAASHTHPVERLDTKQTLSNKYGGGETQANSSSGLGIATGAPAADLPDFGKFGPVERVALRSVRRKIAQNMTQSWSHIPHVTQFDEADITQLEALRARHEAQLKAQGIKLTLTVFVIKAIVSGLKKYPQFNASLDEKTGEIIFKHYYNIGVAVATDRGLIVPVLKNVDQKSVVQLSTELAEVAQKTRTHKIDLDSLHGGTFTVTNIGAIGGTSMVPMINYPEAAILGMAKAAQKPVVRDGKIEIGLIMPLALSFDHRIADGAEAAYFVQHIIKLLQEPFTFILEA